MSWFARIEETCAAFIERAFANMFPSDLEPAQIARKLVATMEARTAHGGTNGMRAPSRYRVYVNPSDFERLAPHKAYLQEEWSTLLSDVAHRVGISFGDGRVSVEMLEELGVVPGGIEIEALSGDAEQPDRAWVPAEPYMLRMVKGMPADATYRIGGATRVGRSTEMEIFLVDPSVSRNHALLDVLDGDLIVRDAGSTNGTFVNGERIERRALRAGDRVAFGKTEMIVEKSPA